MVDDAGESHIVSNFDLKAFLHGLEVRPAVLGVEEYHVEIVLGIDGPCR